MDRKRFLKILTLTPSMVMLGMFAMPGIAVEVPRITKEKLESMLDDPM